MNKFIYQRIRKWLGTLTIPETIKYIPLRSSPCLAIVSPASNIWMRAAEVMKSTASDGIPSSHTTLRSNSVGFCGEMEAGALSCRFIFTSTSCEPKQRRSREYNEVIYLLFSSHNEWSFPLGTGKDSCISYEGDEQSIQLILKRSILQFPQFFYAEAIMSLCFIIRHSHITFLCFSTKDTDNSNQKLHYSEVA